MKRITLMVLVAVLATGCSHIRNLQACRPEPKSPELFTDHGGWDNQSIDDVRCSNEELKEVIAKNKTR